MENKTESTANNTIEIVTQIDDSTLGEIKELDDSIMPSSMQYNEEDLRSCFESKAGVHILQKNAEGKILGYLTSLPKNEEYEDLKSEDPDFTKDDTALYVESVLIKNGDLATAKALFNAFLNMAEERGYKRISMHARVSEGLSDVLQKRYGAKFFKRIENWYGFGEPFDYLEIDLENIKK